MSLKTLEMHGVLLQAFYRARNKRHEGPQSPCGTFPHFSNMPSPVQMHTSQLPGWPQKDSSLHQRTIFSCISIQINIFFIYSLKSSEYKELYIMKQNRN